MCDTVTEQSTVVQDWGRIFRQPLVLKIFAIHFENIQGAVALPSSLESLVGSSLSSRVKTDAGDKNLLAPRGALGVAGAAVSDLTHSCL